jgi:hypothetical protein
LKINLIYDGQTLMKLHRLYAAIVFLFSLFLAACGTPEPLPTLASLPTRAPTKAGSSAPAPASPAATISIVSVPTNANIPATLQAVLTVEATLTPANVRATSSAVALNATNTAIKIATPVPAKPVAANGYLWWVNDRRVNVFVIAPVHQSPPVDDVVANQWASRKEGCFTEAGSSYKLDPSVPAPADIGVGIQVTSGKCKDFKGWVWRVATHAEKP